MGSENGKNGSKTNGILKSDTDSRRYFREDKIILKIGNNYYRQVGGELSTSLSWKDLTLEEQEGEIHDVSEERDRNWKGGGSKRSPPPMPADADEEEYKSLEREPEGVESIEGTDLEGKGVAAHHAARTDIPKAGSGTLGDLMRHKGVEVKLNEGEEPDNLVKPSDLVEALGMGGSKKNSEEGMEVDMGTVHGQAIEPETSRGNLDDQFDASEEGSAEDAQYMIEDGKVVDSPVKSEEVNGSGGRRREIWNGNGIKVVSARLTPPGEEVEEAETSNVVLVRRKKAGFFETIEYHLSNIFSSKGKEGTRQRELAMATASTGSKAINTKSSIYRVMGEGAGMRPNRPKERREFSWGRAFFYGGVATLATVVAANPDRTYKLAEDVWEEISDVVAGVMATEENNVEPKKEVAVVRVNEEEDYLPTLEEEEMETAVGDKLNVKTYMARREEDAYAAGLGVILADDEGERVAVGDYSEPNDEMGEMLEKMVERSEKGSFVRFTEDEVDLEHLNFGEWLGAEKGRRIYVGAKDHELGLDVVKDEKGRIKDIKIRKFEGNENITYDLSRICQETVVWLMFKDEAKQVYELEIGEDGKIIKDVEVISVLQKLGLLAGDEARIAWVLKGTENTKAGSLASVYYDHVALVENGTVINSLETRTADLEEGADKLRDHYERTKPKGTFLNYVNSVAAAYNGDDGKKGGDLRAWKVSGLEGSVEENKDAIAAALLEAGKKIKRFNRRLLSEEDKEIIYNLMENSTGLKYERGLGAQDFVSQKYNGMGMSLRSAERVVQEVKEKRELAKETPSEEVREKPLEESGTRQVFMEGKTWNAMRMPAKESGTYEVFAKKELLVMGEKTGEKRGLLGRIVGKAADYLRVA